MYIDTYIARRIDIDLMFTCSVQTYLFIGIDIHRHIHSKTHRHRPGTLPGRSRGRSRDAPRELPGNQNHFGLDNVGTPRLRARPAPYYIILTLAELHADTFLMKPNKELQHSEPDPDTVTFLMKANKELQHSEPDPDTVTFSMKAIKKFNT